MQKVWNRTIFCIHLLFNCYITSFIDIVIELLFHQHCGLKIFSWSAMCGWFLILSLNLDGMRSTEFPYKKEFTICASKNINTYFGIILQGFLTTRKGCINYNAKHVVKRATAIQKVFWSEGGYYIPAALKVSNSIVVI